MSFTSTKGDGHLEKHGLFTQQPDDSRSTYHRFNEGANVTAKYERVGPASIAQSTLFFMHEYLQDKSAYNWAISGKVIGGPLDVSRLKKALYQVASAHESLRTSFLLDKSTGKPVQAVNQKPRIVVETCTVTEDFTPAFMQTQVKRLRSSSFDISANPLMRVLILSRKGVPEQRIIFMFHHLVVDGFSFSVLQKDLMLAHQGIPLSHPQQAIDMAIRQLQERATPPVKLQLGFWKDVYADGSPQTIPLFPVARIKHRPALQSYEAETVGIKLSAAFGRRVQETGKMMQIPRFHFYLSTLVAHISECLGISSVNIGMGHRNRPKAQDKSTIGHFVNILPLRFTLKPNERFDIMAQRTKSHVVAALGNSLVSVEDILDVLGITRKSNQTPLFQILFDYKTGLTESTILGSSRIEWEASSVQNAQSPYDLVVNITDDANGDISIDFTTQAHLYSADDTKRLLNWYHRALEEFSTTPDLPIKSVSFASTTELQRALELGRGPRLTSDWAPTLMHQIAVVAAQSKQEIAVKDSYGRQLSYGHLMARAAEISQKLASYPLGTCVGVLLFPSVDVICTLLAIMQSGHVYCPLDTQNSEIRLTKIVDSCQPQLIICQDSTFDMADRLTQRYGGVVLNYASMTAGLGFTGWNESGTKTKEDAVGFLLHTSGSTGTPKGVLLTHSAFLNQIWAFSKRHNFGREIVLQQISLGFDLSLLQIFSALANGGSLIVVSKEKRGDAKQMAHVMVNEGITMTCFVPSECLYMLEYASEQLRGCVSWRIALSGGEKLTKKLLHRLAKLALPNLQVINLYGPTETSIACTTHAVSLNDWDGDAEGSSHVGQALPNYSIIIMGSNLRPVPVGFSGEICVLGAGNALGYLKRPTETASSFITANSDLVSEQDKANGWTTLYRTGDKGYLLEDGGLRYVGRVNGDTQIKIRARAGVDGQDIITAFVALRPDFTGDRTAFLEQLKSRIPLPPSMCPTYIVPIDRIPLNTNGKRDQAAINNLPLFLSKDETKVKETFTPLEEQIKKIWEAMIPTLCQGPIILNPDSDFFHVGGNSLLLLRLQIDIKSAFGCFIPVQELFQTSSIRALASRVQASPSSVDQKNWNVNDQIDWDLKIRSLCEEIDQECLKASAEHQSRRRLPRRGLSVVLTGSTGFLGGYILQHLIANKQIAQVHCIGVRPDRSGGQRRLKARSRKIIEHTGDLLHPSLGLSQVDFDDLSNDADIIIHNGADVSFMKSYHSLRRSNVVATQTLIKMALPRLIPYHFVSTAGVADFYTAVTDKPLPATSVGAYPPDPTSTSTYGYAASKWVSEVLLENIASNYNLPVWLHRPTSIVGTGAASSDVTTSLLRYCKRLHAMPDLSCEDVKGAFDFVNADVVAEGIVTAMLNPFHGQQGPRAQGRIIIMHHCSGINVYFDDLDRYLNLKNGAFTRIEKNEWLRRAREAGLDPVVHTFLADLFNQGKPIFLPRLEKGKGPAAQLLMSKL